MTRNERPGRPSLEELLERAAPRAPTTLAPAVLARVAAAERARRLRRGRAYWMMGGALGAAALAATVLLWVRPQPSRSPEAAAPTVGEGWRLAGTAGAVRGDPAPGAARLAEAGELVVEKGSTVRLVSGTAEVWVEGAAAVRVHGDELELGRGKARLRGEGTFVTSAARVRTRGADTDVELVLYRRGNMENRALTVKTSSMVAAALGTALLGVSVYRGFAQVERGAAPPLELAAGDRVLLGQGGPALTLRAPASPAAATSKEAGAAATARALTASGGGAAGTGVARPQAGATGHEASAPVGDTEEEGSLDKEVIRQGVRQIIPGVKSCYEAALEKDPELGGRLLVQFKIRARDGKGVVEEGEILPESDAALLAVPATGQCILEALAAAEFAAPAGDGVVNVVYPFLLRSDD